MKKIILTIALLNSFSAIAVSKEVQSCDPGMLPKFVCHAVESDDGIYRLTESPITVCQGNGKVQVVSKSYKRDVYQATLKESKKKLVYTINDLKEFTPVAKLTISKDNFQKSTFQFIGDWVYQDRICRAVK